MAMTRASWLVLAGLGLGCSGNALSTLSLQDDQGALSINLAPGRAGDDLHQPYGVGAQVLIRGSHGLTQRNHSNLFAEITRGNTAVIVSQAATADDFQVNVRFDGAGDAELTVWSSTARESAVRVQGLQSVVPNGARLFPAVQRVLDPNWKEHAVEPPFHAAVDGDLRIYVELLRDGMPVFGAPLEAVVPEAETGLANVEALSQSDRPYSQLRVRPWVSGPLNLELTSGGAVIRQAQVVAHQPAELAGLDLLKPPMPDDVEDDRQLPVVAQGRLANGSPVWGIPATWMAASNPVEGQADVLNYKFRQGANTAVEVAWGTQRVTGSIEGEAVSVGSAGAGCTAVGPSTSGLLLLLALRLGRGRRVRL